MFLNRKQSSSSSTQQQRAEHQQQQENDGRDGAEQKEEEVDYGSLIMDEFGNLVDANGKIIQSKRTVSSAKINQNRKQKKENILKIEKPPNIKKLDFYDSTLSVPKAERKKRNRGLAFHEQGEFIEKAKMMRELEEEERQRALLKEQLEKERKEQEKIEKEKERLRLIQEELEIGELHMMLGCRRIEDFESTIPDAFWWDKKILKSCKKADENVNNHVDIYQRDFDAENEVYSIKEKLVKHDFVEHPIIVDPLKKKVDAGPLPLMLTKKEQKKMRTQQRIQREKENQRKIALGLTPPPPPKANMGNYMKALLASGQDATELEMKIKKEIEERMQAHEERNNNEKLTKEQRKEKKIRKITEDAESELITILYSIPNIAHPQTRFKINTAKEKGITGAVLSYPSQTRDKDRILLIAEGGKKFLKKYDDVILNKIDWSKVEGVQSENTIPTQSDNQPSARMLWKGTVLKRNFQYFKFQKFEDEESIKNYLNDHGCIHYFDVFANDKNSNTV
ncbi:U4/U6-associated splicing factor HPRP3 [Naegleria gruberi]|uniref:U4/U6-associated splicing factor HPRP3 n=1 Tax=Naegleria gruberi TaxID=5762 RepID=D2VU08_NAEGR|nr:U4/U6-associated splicing factor HPRP3 [Naegleria gruberi]EFC39814.1 U4/U6-associated splicing factor HPRP3 [Naegleria gruberi]|eukprot:XP_002672558.1 U4/U6-associated splicing factor HPRP3 [Naegleria gruberi strain NEG-M]